MQIPLRLFKTPADQARYCAAYDAVLRLWPIPYESCMVTTAYGQTHVISCGPRGAAPLVLLHGGYASSTMWFPNVGDLAANHRVLAVDTIGEPGKSLPTHENATKVDMADWLLGVLDELGIGRTPVVGLSRGGWLALNLAVHAPHRVARVVLLSPASSFIPLNAFFSAMVGGAMRVPARSVARFALNSWVAHGSVVNETFTEQFILGLTKWNWEVNKAGYSGIMPSVFSKEELERVQAPILMLIGEHDRLNPPRAIELARQMIPHLEAAIIPQAGHLLSMEQPQQVDQLILQFLAPGSGSQLN